MAADGASTGYKVLAGVSAIVASTVARKVMAAVWSKATGDEPPANPESPDVTWGEAAAWAIASGVAVGLARLVAQRQVASTWRRASGELPAHLDQAST